MREVVISLDRELIKAKYRKLVRSGRAPGMRSDMKSHTGQQREIARAQLLFAAAAPFHTYVSYRRALVIAQEGRLEKPSGMVRE